MTTRTSEILDLAADQIEKRGWAVGNAGNPGYVDDPWGHDRPTGRICIEGALLAVAGDEYTNSHQLSVECPAYKAVHEFLDLPKRRRLYHWNDEAGRTQVEVVAILRAAAAVERVKEETRELVGA